MNDARARLVTRLNEIYHDLENAGYDGKHPDIEEEEAPRWRRFGSAALRRERGPWSVLDVGTGTGFVPLMLKESLRAGDRLLCADLSAAMLAACAANLARAGLPCAADFLKLDGTSLPVAAASQDLITVNAVLHHLAEPERLCGEIDRALRPGGRVLIGHEPNRPHYDRAFLRANIRLLMPLADFKLFAYETILRLGLFEALRRPLGRCVPELDRHNRLVDGVNARLLAEGAIAAPLGAAEMSSLLDANSPTAGGLRPGRGFSLEALQGYFPGYALEAWETYKHLDKIHVPARRRLLRRYEAWLARRFPGHGSSLFAVLRKPA